MGGGGGDSLATYAFSNVFTSDGAAPGRGLARQSTNDARVATQRLVETSQQVGKVHDRKKSDILVAIEGRPYFLGGLGKSAGVGEQQVGDTAQQRSRRLGASHDELTCVE